MAGQDVVSDGREARRLLAYVPDEPYLYERLTGREFLDFTARIYGLDRATYGRRLAEESERFSLHSFLDQMAEGYSQTLRNTGSADTAIVMRGASASEVMSVLDPDSVTLIPQAPGSRPLHRQRAKATPQSLRERSVSRACDELRQPGRPSRRHH